MENELYDYTSARKAHSIVGFALAAIVLIATAGQILWLLLAARFRWMLETSWGYWLGSFLPLYLVAFPAGLLILKRLPARSPEPHKLPGSALWVLIPVILFFTYSGNLLGTFLSQLLSGGTAQNAVEVYARDASPLKYLFMVILAPLLEELLCRKWIIDRTWQYGEKVAVVFSGFVFGLLHQNFFQFFYAFTVGMVLAYVYIRTGRLRYCVLLHAALNFWGGVLPIFLESLISQDALSAMDAAMSQQELLEAYRQILPGMMLANLYSLVSIGMAIAGLVLLAIKRRQILWKEAECQLPGRRVATVYLNAGMILYFLLCAGSFALALF